jgi:CheY-like chemotaxis protein
MKKHTTNCIKCWSPIKVEFDPPIKKISCIELECCKGKVNFRKSILVVDDEESILKIVKRTLSPMGLGVYATTSSAQAIYSYLQPDNKSWAVLITDIDMPGINGIQIIERMKTRGITIKTIGMSGRNIKETNLFDKFISKPFDIKDLRTTVNELIATD